MVTSCAASAVRYVRRSSSTHCRGLALVLQNETHTGNRHVCAAAGVVSDDGREGIRIRRIHQM